MTRDELKTTLKSPENKMAQEAITLIKTGGPIEKLKELVAQGCSDTFIERDPAHPRSRFLTHKVLDTCFESHFGVTQVRKEGNTEIASLGDVHASEGREGYFELLLSAGFTPGTNGWRGSLFQHILNSCFYTIDGDSRRDQAKKFAKILIASGQFNLQRYAENNYQWVGSLPKLETILELGAQPTPAMTDCALTYVNCSPNSGETTEDRHAVILRLLELGANPTKDLSKFPEILEKSQALAA